MMNLKSKTKKMAAGLAALSLFFAANGAIAYVASSTNYRIQSDSVNIGGILSTSTSYKVEDTLGEIATGVSTSTNYQLNAGYQQMQEVYLSISAPEDVSMSPSIGGVTGGTGNGSASWTVITDDPAGYSLTIKASTSPAMMSNTVAGESFANYTPAGADPDFSWSVASADSEFGFSPEGSDIVQKYKDNGSACNAGSGDTSDKCWDSLSTSIKSIAGSSSANHPSGAVTTVKFRAESGSSHIQVNGVYTATTTVTAIAL